MHPLKGIESLRFRARGSHVRRDNGVARVSRRRACLPIASAPEVPICGVPLMAMAVVRSRRSVLGRIRENAESGAAPTSVSSQSPRVLCADE